jgi:hypothetical protein
VNQVLELNTALGKTKKTIKQSKNNNNKGKTPTTKEKHQQQRKNTNNKGKTPTTKEKHQQQRKNTESDNFKL